jgi:predicted transcriptional regulator
MEASMTIQEAAEILEAHILSGASFSDREIQSACGADMMSDVMAFFHGQGILLTGLVNIQTIRTVSLMDISAVCLVRGKKATQEMLDLAEESQIIVMESKLPMFTACGKLYQKGLRNAAEQ